MTRRDELQGTPHLTDKELMDMQTEATLAAMLRRCRLRAMAAATQAPKSLDDPAAELLPLLAQVAALAGRTAEGREWFVREMDHLRAEMETLLDERRSYWRSRPPGWATALLLRPSVALQLLGDRGDAEAAGSSEDE